MSGANVVVASNRGPVSFAAGNDQLVMRRGGGGLVSALVGAAGQPSPPEADGAEGGGSLWVCSAMSEADRRAAREASHGRLDLAGYDTGGARVRMLSIDPRVFDQAYNAIANRILWFVAHLLFDTSVTPRFDAGFRRQWDSYERYCRAFALAIAEDAAEGAVVLVQDYHLTLTPGLLRRRRPDLRIGFFCHTPWAPPDYFRMLPGTVARDVLAGILGADRAGFHSQRWAAAFAQCCAQVLDAEVRGDVVCFAGHDTVLSVHPLGVDGAELRKRAARNDVVSRAVRLREQVAGRQVILRVDRMELSKNIIRGLEAYRELLRTRPQWRNRVTHIALANPSRSDVPEYREYAGSVLRIGEEIRNEFGTADWEPLVLNVGDDYARSLAAYGLADVLLVNPVRDGMNLVAKEGPILSRDGLVLVLSREAGAADELGADALLVNPFDVSETAEALDEALRMPCEQRQARTGRLVTAAAGLPPQAWLRDQVKALR
ncbi:MAG: alpha,alpha-trehalose-phosphate synthase (UDP-forming) [Frankiaceae bacterium]